MTTIVNASFTLGDLRYDSHAVELTVSLSLLPGVDSFRAWLPAHAELSCQSGDPALLELDGGDGKTTVLTGKVRGLRRGLDGVEVWAADSGADLAAVRPAATYTGQAGRQVVSALADEAGVSVGDVELDLPLAAYTTHQRRTAAEHVAYLAALGGAVASIDGGGGLNVRKRPSGPADAALLYGRELINCRVKDWPGPAATRVVIGNGPAGSADAGDALRPTAAPLPEDAAAPGPEALWEPSAILRTPAAALAGGAALTASEAARGKRLSALCFLQPQLRPGMTIEIQSLPAPLDDGGRWLVRRVVHRVRRAGGATTTFEADSADAGGGTGGLLGVAVQAVGGLL
jgi:hypothetical protein